METLSVSARDGVATVELNRPPRNAMTPLMLEEAYGLFAALSEDRSLRVVVLTGAGGPGSGFCPGTDVDEIAGGDPTPFDPRPFDVCAVLHEMPQVTVAAINGGVAGSGLGWACACDLRAAAASARFSSAFLARGVAGDMGTPWTLPRLVGAAKARELYFLPDPFDAAEAQRIGLVNWLWDDEEFGERLDRLVGRLSSAAPLALRTMKANFVAAETMPFREYLRYETAEHRHQLETEDAGEGFRSWVERRPPVWVGR